MERRLETLPVDMGMKDLYAGTNYRVYICIYKVWIYTYMYLYLYKIYIYIYMYVFIYEYVNLYIYIYVTSPVLSSYYNTHFPYPYTIVYVAQASMPSAQRVPVRNAMRNLQPTYR